MGEGGEREGGRENKKEEREKKKKNWRLINRARDTLSRAKNEYKLVLFRALLIIPTAHVRI